MEGYRAGGFVQGFIRAYRFYIMFSCSMFFVCGFIDLHKALYVFIRFTMVSKHVPGCLSVDSRNRNPPMNVLLEVHGAEF